MKIIVSGETFSPELIAEMKNQVGKNLTISIEFEHNNGKYVDTGITKNNMPVLKFIPAEKRYTKCLIKLKSDSGSELHYAGFARIKKKDNFNRNVGRDLSFTRAMHKFIFNKVLTKSQRTLVWNEYWSRSSKTVARNTNRSTKMTVVYSSKTAA